VSEGAVGKRKKTARKGGYLRGGAFRGGKPAVSSPRGGTPNWRQRADTTWRLGGIGERFMKKSGTLSCKERAKKEVKHYDLIHRESRNLAREKETSGNSKGFWSDGKKKHRLGEPAIPVRGGGRKRRGKKNFWGTRRARVFGREAIEDQRKNTTGGKILRVCLNKN